MYSTSDDNETDDRKTGTVLAYFSKPHFFENIGDQINFVNRYERLDRDQKMKLLRTPHEFFHEALQEGSHDEFVLKYFFKDNVYGCNAYAVLLDFNEWKKDNNVVLNDDERSKVSHKEDLDCIPEGVSQEVPMLDKTSNYQSRQHALNLGSKFVASILTEIQEIPGSDGMRVLPQVVQLETGDRYDLVIRRVTEPFWKECIEEARTPDMRIRVCAVGTPGIGKTNTTPFLIRMLLVDKITVVYRVASAGFFWEFSWRNDKGYVVRVHTEGTPLSALNCLTEPSTFYIVDSGSSGKNCAPDASMKARIIIVSSTNERHWGGNYFGRMRNSVMGRFKYLPMWELEDILNARGHLCSELLSDEEILERFRLFGGIPRLIFAKHEDLPYLLRIQSQAIDALTVSQAQQIVERKLDVIGLFGANQPRSAVIGYAAAQTEEEWPFSSPCVAIVSQSVTERIIEKFMGSLWNLMLTNEWNAAWWIFEVYCQRVMLTQPGLHLLGRPGCGKNDSKYQTQTMYKLGGCTAIRLGSNLGEAVLQSDPMILFHSANARHELIDFIYKDKKETVHAFQVTLQKKHKVNDEQIPNLRKTLGNKELVLYYLVPAENYYKFVTDPVDPTKDKLTSINHILIPNPKKELKAKKEPKESKAKKNQKQKKKPRMRPDSPSEEV